VRIIPVIDVKDGIVVRAVAGRRELYLPLRSRLTQSVEPFDVARALLDATGAKELYIADLDGLMRGEPNGALLELAERLNVELWLDVGLKNTDGWEAAPGVRPILATETWGNYPLPLRERVVCEADRVRGYSNTLDPSPRPEAGRPSPSRGEGEILNRPILSLDYFSGVLRTHREWNPADFATAIVLDTAAVGVGEGLRTIYECIELRQQFRHLDLITGGGVRNRDDLRDLEDIGVNGVLIASALHDGMMF